MTIDEYAKQMNLPEMKVLGEMKNFRYYIKKNVPQDREEGIPRVVEENKINKTFNICDAEQARHLISLFL